MSCAIETSSRSMAKENQAAIDCFALTDVGSGRPENQDQFIVADLAAGQRPGLECRSGDGENPLRWHDSIIGQPDGKLLLVADGLGGHAAGQRASQVAAERALAHLVEQSFWTDSDHDLGHTDDRANVSLEMRRAVQMCQASITDEVCL